MRDDAGVVELGDDAVGHVASALTRPTGQQHQIRGLERLAQPLAQRRHIVRNDPEPRRLAAGLADGVGQHLRVGVVDAGRLHRIARRDDLVARGQNRDDRLAPDIDFGDANGRQHAGIAARQQLTLPQHGFAGGDVGAGERHAAAGGHGSGDPQHSPPRVRVLDHHDGVSTARHHAAGGNRRRLARMDRRSRNDAGVNVLVDQADDARGLFGCAERVLGDDREAVHVGAIERRDVDRGQDVGGEDASKRGVQWNPLDTTWGQVQSRAEPMLRLVAVEDLEKLLLLRHRARRRPRSLRQSLRCRHRRSRNRRRASWTTAPTRRRPRSVRHGHRPASRARNRAARWAN